MDISTPTFHSLTAPQKRALILRDQLRYLDPSHLDTFIARLANPEPPTYHLITNENDYDDAATTCISISPPLQLVCPTSAATDFDLGNVVFPEENHAVYHTHLLVDEAAQVEMRRSVALDMDDGDLESVPIHGFIAGTMVPMLKEKVQAIEERCRIINEARTKAYHAVEKHMENEREKMLARHKVNRRDDDNESSSSRAESPTAVCQPTFPAHQQHPNKRRKLADRIFPHHSATEMTAFDAIPSQLKIDLVDSIIKTAVPGLDDLLAVASSVVSTCLDAEAESWERNKSILELKDVLEIFGVTLQGSGQEESKSEVDVGRESNEEYAVLNKEQNESIVDQAVEVPDRESGLDNAVEQQNVNIEPEKTPTPPDLQQPDTFQDEKQYISRGTQYIQPSYDGPQTPGHDRTNNPPHSPSGSFHQPVPRLTPQGPVQQLGYDDNNNTRKYCRCSQCIAEWYQKNEEESHQHESGYTMPLGQNLEEVSRGCDRRKDVSTGSVPLYSDGSYANENIFIPHANTHREQNHQLPQDWYQQQYRRPNQHPSYQPEKSPFVNNKIQTYQRSAHQNSLNGLDNRNHTVENQSDGSLYHPGTQCFEHEATNPNSFSTASAPRNGSNSTNFPNTDETRHPTHSHRFPQAQLTRPSPQTQHQDKQRQPNLGTSLLGKRKTPPQTQNQPRNQTHSQSQPQHQTRTQPNQNQQTHNYNNHPNRTQNPSVTRTNKDKNSDSGKPNPGNKPKAPVAPMLHVRRLGMFEGMRG